MRRFLYRSLALLLIPALLTSTVRADLQSKIENRPSSICFDSQALAPALSLAAISLLSSHTTAHLWHALPHPAIPPALIAVAFAALSAPFILMAGMRHKSLTRLEQFLGALENLDQVPNKAHEAAAQTLLRRLLGRERTLEAITRKLGAWPLPVHGKSSLQGRTVLVTLEGLYSIMRIDHVSGIGLWEMTTHLLWTAEPGRPLQFQEIPRETEMFNPRLADETIYLLPRTLAASAEPVILHPRPAVHKSNNSDILEQLNALSDEQWEKNPTPGVYISRGLGALFLFSENILETLALTHEQDTDFSISIYRDFNKDVQVHFVDENSILRMLTLKDMGNPYRKVWIDTGQPGKLWIGVDERLVAEMTAAGLPTRGTAQEGEWKIVGYSPHDDGTSGNKVVRIDRYFNIAALLFSFNLPFDVSRQIVIASLVGILLTFIAGMAVDWTPRKDPRRQSTLTDASA